VLRRWWAAAPDWEAADAQSDPRPGGRYRLSMRTDGGQIHTVGGDVTVGARSRVHGGILIEKPHGVGFHWGKNRIPRVVIGPNAVVDGELRFEREVELFVHPSARIGKVSGATAQPWTDQLPPRK
jgi:hypothetical protein